MIARLVCSLAWLALVGSVTAAESAAADASPSPHSEAPTCASDIDMPEKDGLEMMRKLWARPATGKVPAIALAAFARSKDRTRAILAGYQVHLTKPVEPQELLAAVANLAGRTGIEAD